MENLNFHPFGKFYPIAERIFKGAWSAALFNHQSGKRLYLGGGANQANSNEEKQF